MRYSKIRKLRIFKYTLQCFLCDVPTFPEWLFESFTELISKTTAKANIATKESMKEVGNNKLEMKMLDEDDLQARILMNMTSLQHLNKSNDVYDVIENAHSRSTAAHKDRERIIQETKQILKELQVRCINGNGEHTSLLF